MEKKSTRGGKRPGAGRRPLSGKYKEKTEPIRLPVSKIEWVKALMFDPNLAQPLMLIQDSVSAGSPFEQSDSNKSKFDLKEFLHANNKDTYLIRAAGDSMIDAGIFDNDILSVSITRPAHHNDIVIALVDGASTVKRLIDDGERKYLKAENAQCSNIDINNDQSFEIQGVVTGVIRKL